MSPHRFRLLFVGLAAFALGLLTAGVLPVATAQSPKKELVWEQKGQTLRLTAAAEGAYLVLETGNDGPGRHRGSSALHWSKHATVSSRGPTMVYSLQGFLDCPSMGECNECRGHADDCPPPPKGPFGRLKATVWIPSFDGRP